MGTMKNIYININGRVEATLIPGMSGYPFIKNARFFSVSVSSLEADGVSCVNVGINPLRGSLITEYVIDLRKSVCVHQFNQNWG